MSKNKLVLKDNTKIDLETGASLAAMTAVFSDKAAMITAWEKLTPDNLSAVSVQNGDGLTVGSYTALVLLEPHMAVTELSDGAIQATFGMREKTDAEKRLDAAEEALAVHDGAIGDMGAVISAVAEAQEGGKA